VLATLNGVPPASNLPVFCVAAIALLVVPGPSVLFIVARSSSQGLRAGVVSVLGVHAASIVHISAAVVGLSALVVASALAFTVVKVVGGVYLVYLGVRAILAAHARTTAAVTSVQQRAPLRIFVEAFTVNLFNPKTAIFFLAFLPQFVDPDHGQVWSQTLILGLVFIALGICSDGIYAFLGAHVGARFQRRAAARLRATRYAEGGILIGLGALTLAIPHRSSA
jgi:threonine/homoserine/homoserine lactone efflux protein